MPVIPANFGPAFGAWGTFRPHGKRVYSAVRSNPAKRLDAPFAARFFVGFSVGKKRVHTLPGLMRRVRQLRKAHPDATFVGQHGIYASVARPGEVVMEEGAQVLIINTYGAPYDVFLAEMVQLGEFLCRDMQQEAVILEMQQSGIVRETFSVTA